MRTELVYSFLALGGAIPVTVNAADVQTINADVLASTDGGKVAYAVGKLVPGKYAFSAKIASKVYGVKVAIAGKTADVTSNGNPTDPNVNIEFTLDEETDVELTLVSTDPGESGAGFTVAEAKVALDFDFNTAKSNLIAKAEALKTTNIPAYPYTSTDDETAVDNLVAKINAIAKTYEAYVEQKLYQENSVPQGNIDALASTIAEHQNTQAYNDVNALITAIKAEYNKAVAGLKEKLVDQAAYLLNDALADLNDNINEKITEATKASYASYTGKTAVADKTNNVDKIPTEAAIKAIVDKWEDRGTKNQDAYNTLHAKVTALQTGLDAIKPVKAIEDQFATEKAEAQAAIDVVNADVEAAKNSAAQLTLNVDAKEATAQGKISTLAGKVTTANAEFNANKKTTEHIALVQKAYNDAKNTVDAKVSKDGDYKAADYYADYLKTQQDAINKLTSDAAAAYKEDGTGTAQTYNAGLADKTAPIIAAIDNYQNKAVEAVEKYDALQTAINGVDAEHPGYQGQLDAARAKVDKEYHAVYTDPAYDYETQFDLIQKRINDINKAIKTAQEKKGADHWDAMLAIDADADITTDIAALLSSVQSDQNKYDAESLTNGMTTLSEKITAFKAKDATVLGNDVTTFKDVETGIETAYNNVKTAKEAINAQSETVNYTDKVDRTWGGLGAAGAWAAPHVGVDTDPVTLDVPMYEKYNGSSCQETGVIISQTINVENGIYDVKLFANANHANGVDNEHAITGDAKDVAFVFANGKEEPITAKNQSTNAENGEYTISGVEVTDGKLTIGIRKDKQGTNWHTIQIKSLTANTASLIQGWGKKVDDLNKQQTALEAAADDVAAKVAANAQAKTNLATNIGDNEATPKTGMWKSIDDFKTLYKIGTAESTLGNRGKAGGEVAEAVATLEKDLTALQAANSAVDPTAVMKDDKSSAVNNTPSGWALADMAHTGNANRWTGDKIDGKQLAEQYTSAGAADYGKAGIVMKQKLTGLANGIYDVVLYANAVDQASGNPNKDKTDIAYVYANDAKVPVKVTAAFNATQEGYELKNIVVSDGTLELGLAKAKGGTNWHSIMLKSLKYHENDQLATYSNTEKTGYNDQYTELSGKVTKLQEDAPNIKKAVENNAAAYKQANTAMEGLKTYIGSKLKNDASVNLIIKADGSYSGSAKQTVYTTNDFQLYRTGLEKDYGTVRDEMLADTTAMRNAINAAFAAETLPYPWNGEITVTTPDDPATPDTDESSSTTYKVADIKAAVDVIRATAEKEQANWYGYRQIRSNGSKDAGTKAGVNDTQMTTAFTNARKDLATKAGTGADAYYFALVGNGSDITGSYETDLANIRLAMFESLKGRTAVADQAGYIAELRTLKAKINTVQADAAANLAKYTEQKKAASDTQELWNSTYTEIAATDQSTKVQEWLSELDQIQVDLTAADKAVEANYEVGKSVAGAQDFAKIQAAIKDVKARQSDTYNAQISEDNKLAHETFMGNETTKGTIQQATEAYQKAVKERAQYSSTNEDIKVAVDAAAAELDKALFSCPGDIATLTNEENEAYVATVSPEVFDVDDFNTRALAIEKNITNQLNSFKAAVKDAINGVWTPNRTEYSASVTAAESDISGYSADAKKDAFKDVKDLIAKGDAGVQSITLSEVEAAIAGLENIDDMLAADKDAAAVKDITAALTAADKAYNDTKAYIEGKTIADDVNDVKATQLNNLEDAKAEADATLVEYPKEEWAFDNHDKIKAKLQNVVTTANTAKEVVDAAVANDVANTAAYNEIMAALTPVEKKLAEAKAAIAPYKYPTSFETQEGRLELGKTLAKQYKEAGNAVDHKGAILSAIESEATQIETVLTNAFNNEKTGLSADITELKNQFNTYVANNGLNETANGYKKDIDDLEAARSAAEIKDLDNPTDDIQYDEILAATEALIKIQNDIAAKESELLAANGSEANANVLADFQAQLSTLKETASLDGYDEWVANQPYGDTTLGDAITNLKSQIADLETAINAEQNISFYKDQYQKQIDDIKAELNVVSTEIAAKDAQFKENAAVYAKLSVQIDELQGKIDAAKAKVGAYEYASEYYINIIETYNDKGELNGGVQYQLNTVKKQLEDYNKDKLLTEAGTESIAATTKTNVESGVQNYLDMSAAAELKEQIANLGYELVNAIDVDNHEGVEKYSPALWDRLVAEKDGISDEITALSQDVTYSEKTHEGTFDEDGEWEDILDDKNKPISKPCTSDADYADQMARVNEIKGEIATLGEAVDNLNLLGDANVDGKVNVLDYQKVANMILDPTLQPEEDSDLFANIDINRNSVVEVGDLTAIVNYILNQDWQGNAAVKSMVFNESESLSTNISSIEGGKQRIAVSLANVNDYTAFQMDVVLPEGVTLAGTSLTDRAGESHKLMTRKQLDGSIRLLASSVTGETFSGNEGAVLYIDVEGANANGVELLNIIFAESSAQTRIFNINGEATGIATTSTLETLKQKVYDISGRLVDGLKKGINIIRRADGSTQKVLK